MPLVMIQAPALSSEQKQRIGDRVVQCLHQEGIPASSVVVLFQRDKSDIYLDGSLVHEVEAAPEGAWEPRAAHPAVAVMSRAQLPDLLELRERVEELLMSRGELSSFDAQEGLGLRDAEGVTSALRKVFTELEADGMITKQGQKRGTRYVWKGALAQSAPPMPILVKRMPADDEASMPEMRMDE